MPLQLRVRHAMGEKLLEVPVRDADKPYVLGRGQVSDLKLPSVKLLAAHCALYVQNGQWVIADRSGGVLKLNGKPISGTAALHVGDQVVLAPEEKPTTLLIEPGRAALGEKGAVVTEGPVSVEAGIDDMPVAEAVDESEAPEPVAAPIGIAPMSPPPAIRVGGPPQRPISPSIRPTSGAAVPPPRPPSVGAREAAPVDPDTIDMGEQQQAYTPTHTRGVRRPPPGPSGLAIALGVVVALAIVGGTGFVVYRQMQHPTQVVIIEQAPKPTASTAPAPQVVRSTTAPTSAPVIAKAPVEDLTSETAAANPTDENPAADPHAGDLEWLDLQAAHDGPDQARALMKYDDYRRRNPGKNGQELRKMELDTVDQLWWQRISMLWQARTRLKADLEKKDTEISEETNDAFKAKLIQEKAELEHKLADVEKTLQVDMGFKDQVLPNFSDEPSLNAARLARDKSLYSIWAKNTTSYIRLHGGELPWGSEP